MQTLPCAVLPARIANGEAKDSTLWNFVTLEVREMFRRKKAEHIKFTVRAPFSGLEELKNSKRESIWILKNVSSVPV